MKGTIGIHFVILCLLLLACKNTTEPLIPIPSKEKIFPPLTLDDQAYYDKVLGALVGSAIGDAMGATTEMWHWSDIQNEYGYITGLQLVNRERSAEGIWRHNLDSGATTDDTRWKYLMVQYLKNHRNQLNADQFVEAIISYYQSTINDLTNKQLLKDTELLDTKMLHVNWIKEWARVALAYQKGGDSFEKAKGRFYGGEMSCAGMLYTPMFGLISRDPEEAYNLAFEHALFDIGYAKDISSLVAVISHMALNREDITSVVNNSLMIDPYNYLNSRLIGRMSLSITKDIKSMLHHAKAQQVNDSSAFELPRNYPLSKSEWSQQLYLYEALDKDKRHIAFHAAEIWQILATALLFGEGKFEKTIQFIINYGRDNDTVAAIAGFILGAQLGFEKLPKDLRETILEVNKNDFGIDFQQMAKDLVQMSIDVH